MISSHKPPGALLRLTKASSPGCHKKHISQRPMHVEGNYVLWHMAMCIEQPGNCAYHTRKNIPVKTSLLNHFILSKIP